MRSACAEECAGVRVASVKVQPHSLLAWRAGALADAEHTPFGQYVFYFSSLFGLLFLKNWYISWSGASPSDTTRGWGWIFYGNLLRAVRTVDSLSDLGLAALLYRELTASSCAWHGKQDCEVYLTLLILVAVAAGSDYIISALFIFITAAKHGRTHILLHLLALLCEACIFSATVLLQLHTQAPVVDGAAAVVVDGAAAVVVGAGRVAGAQWFFILSGATNLATFVMNCVGLNNVLKFVSQRCVARKLLVVTRSVHSALKSVRVPFTTLDTPVVRRSSSSQDTTARWATPPAQLTTWGSCRKESGAAMAASLETSPSMGGLVSAAHPLGPLVSMLSMQQWRSSNAVSDASMTEGV